jgi:acyl-CoA reductase-like NAD-dependent aldehyde dehydrogenase
MTATITPPAARTDIFRQAREPQRRWAELPVRERTGFLQWLRPALVSTSDLLCEALAKDLGKRPEEVVGGELLPLAAALRYLQRRASRLLRPRRVPRGERPLWLFGQADTIHRRPRGVVGIIGTWNYPYYLNGVQIAQALVAGNAVVWKPSEVAPNSAGALKSLLQRCGLPDGLFQVLPETREAGATLVEGDVDHVVFTGSEATGRRIATRLGERLISSTLELSGNDAQFVLADADVDLAARAAWFGTTLNRGQTCIAVRRSFVHRSIYSAFCDALKPLAEAGQPLPLALAQQARQAHDLVRQAVAGGGRLLAENSDFGDAEAGTCRPLVVVDARPDMALCREAPFAPVMAVLPFDDLDEAVRMDAQCPYALGASVFTRDRAGAARLAGRLRAGNVTVNDVVLPTAHPATPFGGSAASGWGSTQGAEGLLEMTVPQVVSVSPGRFRPHYDQAPGRHGRTMEGLLTGMLQMSHGRGWSARWRGFGRLLRGLFGK